MINTYRTKSCFTNKLISYTENVMFGNKFFRTVIINCFSLFKLGINRNYVEYSVHCWFIVQGFIEMLIFSSIFLKGHREIIIII